MFCPNNRHCGLGHRVENFWVFQGPQGISSECAARRTRQVPSEFSNDARQNDPVEGPTGVAIEDTIGARPELQDEDELRRIVDLIPQYIVVLDAGGKAIFANRQTLEYTGLSLDEVSAGDFRERLFHPEDVERLREERTRALAGAIPFQYEQRVLGRDGRYRWFMIRYNPLLDESGKVVRWYCAATEIEDLKQAENKLRQGEQELRQLIDLFPQCVVVLDKQGSLLQANQTMLNYYDRTLGEMKDRRPEDRYRRDLHPDDLERVLSERSTGLSRGVPFESEKRLLGKDGRYRWFLFRYRPVVDGDGDIVRWVATATDVENLKQGQDYLRRVLDTTPALIHTARPDGYLDYFNQRWLDYLDVRLDDIRGWNWTNWIHPEDLDDILRKWRAALASGEPFEAETRVRRADGEYRRFLHRKFPLRDKDGKILQWFGSSLDIEDHKRADDALKNAFDEIKKLKDQLHKENLALKEEIDKVSMFEDIVGSSDALRKVLRQVAKVAPSDSTVLILGETGTGKELIARAIHKRSRRSERAFIGVNCAAIPPSLIASELFGHEKGAFTGATQRRLGRFESANGGTIFLDEVGDLPPEIQIALLRVLQEREIERLGSSKAIPVDVRVLAATHRDLDTLVAQGKFRQDLLYRLSVVPIQMPSLRERADDIPVLVDYFVGRFGKQVGKKFTSVDKGTAELFESYPWPGNVRELQNVVERAVILGEGDVFLVDETWLKQQAPQFAGPTLSGTLQRQEKEMIEAALAESGGRISGPEGAASKLGLPRPTLDAKIKRLGINKYQFRVQRSA